MTVDRVDAALVRQRLRYLVETVEVLRRFQGLSPEQLSETATAWSVEHGLQVAIQAVLDITSHLVAALGGRIGDTYRETLLELGQLGVIPLEFARQIAPMAGLRNILVHEYLQVDVREIHRVLTRNLDDLLTFAAYVEQFLRQSCAGGGS